MAALMTSGVRLDAGRCDRDQEQKPETGQDQSTHRKCGEAMRHVVASEVDERVDAARREIEPRERNRGRRDAIRHVKEENCDVEERGNLEMILRVPPDHLKARCLFALVVATVVADADVTAANRRETRTTRVGDHGGREHEHRDGRKDDCGSVHIHSL